MEEKTNELNEKPCKLKEKLDEFEKKLGKLLLRLLLIALVCGLSYLVYVHRKAIRALIKGEPLPQMPKERCCPFAGKKGWPRGAKKA